MIMEIIHRETTSIFDDVVQLPLFLVELTRTRMLRKCLIRGTQLRYLLRALAPWTTSPLGVSWCGALQHQEGGLELGEA